MAQIRSVLTKIVYILFISFSFLQIQAQPACALPANANCFATGAGSTYDMPSTTNITVTFNSIGEYLAGITINGATLLRLIVAENIAPCRWELNINTDNNGGATPINEWELLTAYGTSGSAPTVNMINFKVRNQCNTSLTGAAYTNMADINATIPIILNPGIDNPSGACPQANVNTEGSYLTDYGHYHFDIDYRIQPTLTLKAGLYQLTVRYCLRGGA